MRWLPVLLLSCLVNLFPGDAAAVSISLTPPGQFVSVGGAFTLTLEVGALGGSAVGAFDVDVSFDATRFTLEDVSFGAALGDEGLGEQIPGVVNGTGSVSLASVSLLDAVTLAGLQGDPVSLVTLTFRAVTVGAGAFAIEAAQLSDEFGADLAIGSVSPATVDVVPEPRFALLLALVAAGLARRPPR